MIAKRIFDLVISGIGILLLCPILIAISIWIKFDSKGPVFFRQERVGQYGNLFRIHKFRTMITDAEKVGLQITVGRDSRITRSGFFLRRYKLDELPQLIDVVFGKMSLVGPRPEVPKYVAYYPTVSRELVLSMKPGITDLASILYRDENTLLSLSGDAEKTYIEEILPVKLKYYTEYAYKNNLYTDFCIILRTLHLMIT